MVKCKCPKIPPPCGYDDDGNFECCYNRPIEWAKMILAIACLWGVLAGYWTALFMLYTKAIRDY
eukprot:CAMPEP_0119131220 /NCGR_PEP_ID=MMETSP1310-20130426/9774_1 /TAXON_ID=464262 /ORGANISM="Genus nov. species nov., Strain RCC2339" /LENGTH=63 /DNA_ID=CAMNT_0007121775 /DNA_START=72 /DNA_END=263 /DNA_ORIENTATION=+